MANPKRGPYSGTGYKEKKRISVDDKTVDILTDYGNGNFSLGVRMAAVLVESETAKNRMFTFGKGAENEIR